MICNAPKIEPLYNCTYAPNTLDRDASVFLQRLDQGSVCDVSKFNFILPQYYTRRAVAESKRCLRGIAVGMMLSAPGMTVTRISLACNLTGYFLFRDIRLGYKRSCNVGSCYFLPGKTLIRIITTSRQYIFGNYYFGNGVPGGRRFEQHVKHVHAWKKGQLMGDTDGYEFCLETMCESFINSLEGTQRRTEERFRPIQVKVGKGPARLSFLLRKKSDLDHSYE